MNFDELHDCDAKILSAVNNGKDLKDVFSDGEIEALRSMLESEMRKVSLDPDTAMRVSDVGFKGDEILFSVHYRIKAAKSVLSFLRSEDADDD